MASSTSCSSFTSSQSLLRPKIPKLPFLSPSPSLISVPRTRHLSAIRTAAASKSNSNAIPAQNDKKSTTQNPKNEKEEEEIEVEEELPWIQEKALDLVEFTGSVTQALPGPRVGQSSLPWILALPLAYAGVSFVIAFVKTVRKFRSPREKRRKLV